MQARKALLIVGASIGVLLPILPFLGLVLGPTQGGLADQNVGLSFSHAASSLVTTLALAALVSAFALSIGTTLAMLERRYTYFGRNILAALCLIPLAVPSYVLAATLRESLGPAGFGLRTFSGFWAAVITLSLSTTPLVQLLIASALTRIPVQEEQAARALGASSWRTFKVAILPRLRPSLTYSFLLTQLYVISDFGAVAMLNVPTLTWRLYLAVNTQQSGRALVLGATLLLASLPLFFVARWALGRDHAFNESVSNPRSEAPRHLRGYKLIAAYLIQALVVILGVGIPVLTLLAWINSGSSEASLWQPIKDTSMVAIFGAIITVSLAFFPACLIARSSSRWSAWLERAVYLSSAMPGVLLAFGLLLLTLAISRGIDPDAGIYDSLSRSGTLLMIGYATRFIAEAFSSLKASLMRLSIREEESARALGVGFWKRSLRLSLPALWPGFAVAFVITLVAIMKELPVTLMLGGAMGLQTLSFRMFDRYQDAFMPDAGWAGISLVSLALLSVLLSMRWRHHA